VKCNLAQGFWLTALAIALLFALIEPGTAGDWRYRHHYRHHVYTYVEPLPPYVPYAYGYAVQPPAVAYCRVGWWQGLSNGHVRPHWGAWC
jgi:hypothetical protein